MVHLCTSNMNAERLALECVVNHHANAKIMCEDQDADIRMREILKNNCLKVKSKSGPKFLEKGINVEQEKIVSID